MKNLSFLTLAGLLATTSITALNAAETLNCAKLPTCEELGYADTVAQCPGKSLKCPFDKTKGLCQHDAAIGQIGYFPYQPGKGWLKCNGFSYSKNKYPDLYAKIGTKFGGGGDIFSVPDYRGDFVRVYGGSSSSVTKRQTEGLPNITGSLSNGIAVSVSGESVKPSTPNGAFSGTPVAVKAGNQSGEGRWMGYIDSFTFNASKYNSIYGTSSHVTPVNTAVYAYIYAGRIDSTAPSLKNNISTCSKGDYFYTDATCSSSYNSSKTVIGIVYSVDSKDEDGAYWIGDEPVNEIYYISGGVSGANSHENASQNCANSSKKLEEYSYWKTLPTNISTSQSVVRSVKSGNYYWDMRGSKYYCSTSTSCSTSTTTATSGSAGSAYMPYYYCYGKVHFGD